MVEYKSFMRRRHRVLCCCYRKKKWPPNLKPSATTPRRWPSHDPGNRFAHVRHSLQLCIGRAVDFRSGKGFLFVNGTVLAGVRSQSASTSPVNRTGYSQEHDKWSSSSYFHVSGFIETSQFSDSGLKFTYRKFPPTGTKQPKYPLVLADSCCVFV
ncbi:hypothetical protein GGR58DRAFT_9868 [Xylaria digitata]|nr:hypothetical protein GGR58DRAFT_9868 [Xylaria digitata]